MKKDLMRPGKVRREAAVLFRLVSAGCFVSALVLLLVTVPNQYELARLLGVSDAVFEYSTAILFLACNGCGLYFAFQARLARFVGTPEQRAEKKRAFEEEVARAEESLGIRGR